MLETMSRASFQAASWILQLWSTIRTDSDAESWETKAKLGVANVLFTNTGLQLSVAELKETDMGVNGLNPYVMTMIWLLIRDQERAEDGSRWYTQKWNW